MKKSLLLSALVLFTASLGYSVTVYSENFDGNTTLNGWTVSSSDYAARYTGTYKIGTAALRVRYNANAVATVSSVGYENLTLTAKMTAYSLESGETSKFQYNAGSGWVTVGTVTDGLDNGTYKTYSANLPSAANNNANLQIRFITASSSSYDYGYIDDITMTGTAVSTSTPTTPVATDTWTSDTANYISANYPSNYPDNEDTTTTITKSGATKIRVHFSAFDTESGYDFVRILDGSGVEKAKYDGTKGAFTSVEVTGDTLKVRMTSDGSVNRTGFKIDKVEYVGTSGTTPVDPPVDPPATGTIFEDSFASSTLGSSWSISGDGDYRVRVTSSYTPRGSYHVALDDSTSGGYSTSQLTLNKDLTGYKNIVVEYYYKEYGDENHAQDGLYIYNGSWVQVKSFNNGPGTHTLQTVDLSAYSGITKIRWQQYDNYGLTSDGICIDDVKVTGEAVGGGTTTPVTSSHSGMGANIYSGGVSFRVWAPNATSASVAGDFNSWSATATGLASEGNGFWSTDVAGATVGQKYKFVINGDGWRKDPYGKKVEHSSGASIIYSINTPSGIGLPYFEDQIIYQLHVGSFYRSSSTGVGTFYDTATKAQYLKDLGVNMVEVLPIMEFAGDNSWGYNPSGDIYAPESAYGGPEGLAHLVTSLHNKGLGLILDLVYNHLGPSDMTLWQFDGWSENNGGGIYFYNDWRAETPWGHTRPDYGRGEVRTYLRDNAVFWLQQYNVDGLRWDSTINIRKHNYSTDLPDGWSILQYINNEINAAKGSAISIAEDLAKDAWVTYDTGSGGAGFDSQWDAGFVHPVKGAIEASWDSGRDMGEVAGALAVKYGDRTKQLIYVSSHDEVGNGKCRPPSAIDNGNPGSWFAKKRSTLGTGILMTAPGIPMIFQGEEWCQPGYFANSVFDNFIDWNLASAHSGIVQMYKDLISVRKNYAALRSNNINVFHVDNENKLIAFHRWSGSQNVVVIANFADKTWNGNYSIGWPVWKTGHCAFNGDWNGYDAGFGNHGGWDVNPTSGGMDGMGQKASISIAPYTVQVYDLY